MSDSIVINVIPDPSTNITINDTGENVYLNPLTLNQGIINHSVTHQSGGSDELLHNLLAGLNGGQSGQYYHLNSGQYFNLTTGDVVRPSDTGNFITINQTGVFYPNSNPSGFITGVDLSGYVTGDVVRPSQTGNFITTSQTGSFYSSSNPSGFITGVDLSNYTTIGYVTGISGSLQGQINEISSITGDFYPANNPSGFITGVDLSIYSTIDFATGISGNLQEQITNLSNNTGEYVTGDVVRPDQTGEFYPKNNPSGFITGVDLSSYATINFTTGISGSLQTQINDLENISGDFVLQSETGVFYAASNPSGFITGVDLSSYATQSYVTGASGFLQTQINTLNNQTGSYVLDSETGNFIITGQTGEFYPRSNPSGFITGIDNIVYTTGDQTISGTKQFINRPTVNGTGVMLSGEATQLPSGIVFTSGSQSITGLKTFDNLGFNTNAAVSASIGQFAWNATDSTLDLGLNSNVTLQLGQEIHYPPVKALQDIRNGMAVFAAGAVGGSENIEVRPFRAKNGDADELYFIGIATENITANNYGFVSTFGKVRGVNGNSYTAGGVKDSSDTGAWNFGAVLYASPNISGCLTQIPPTAPDKRLPIAMVLKAPNQGNITLMVRADHGYHLSEIHDVYSNGKLDRQVLMWNSGSGYWSNDTITTGDVSGLSNYATQSYVTETSGFLQTQINTLNNHTGDYVLDSETGQFYPANNPSGFITGVDLSNVLPLSGGTVTGALELSSDTAELSIVDTTDFSEYPPARNLISVNSEAGELFTLNNYGIAKFSTIGDLGHNWYLLGNIDGIDAQFNQLSITNAFVSTLYAEAGDTINLDGNLAITGTISATNIVTTTGNQTIAGLKTFSNNIVGNGTANTLPNQTLSNTDNTRILTQKTSARDDMWSCWQKRMLMYGSAAGSGTGFGTTGSQRSIGVSCGIAAVGRASSCYETGMTVNPGQGAAWNIPSSFAVGFGFYGLYVNIVATSNNITSGSNTFTSSNVGQLALGHRIYSTAFPEETYVQAINGYIVTASKNAIDTPGNGHPIVFAPDQISRFVLGSSPTRIHEACPNANDLFQTQAANSIGDTSIKLNASTALTIAGTVILWNNQPYFISTVANSNISNANANFYVAGSYLPSTTINVLRIDNVVGTPATTTGTWNGTVTPTNQIVVASATNIVANQTVSGLGIPHNTTVLSVAGTTVTLNQNITSAGSGVAVYFGYQRVYIDQNATSTQTGQNAGFFAKSYLNQYIYGRGLPSATTMTNISNYTSSIFTVTVSQAFTKACVSGLFYAVNFTTDNLFTGNNCIFMEYSSDPADGYLKVRLGYMLNGIITYSAWTSFPMGNIPNANYNFLYQAVIDYNAATGQLRLFVDRNGAILTSGNPRDWPKPPATATITLSGVEALNNKTTGQQFGVQIFGNNVNTLANTTTAALYVRDAVYYPYQTFID